MGWIMWTDNTLRYASHYVFLFQKSPSVPPLHSSSFHSVTSASSSILLFLLRFSFFLRSSFFFLFSYLCMACHRVGHEENAADSGTSSGVHPRDHRNPPPILVVRYIVRYGDRLDCTHLSKMHFKNDCAKVAMFALVVLKIPPEVFR